jgi:membrane protease YdiL (CAAX protease family)
MQNRTDPPSLATDRFNWIERPGREFPFFNDQPAHITGPQWLLVMAMVVAGLLAVALPIAWPFTPVGKLVPTLLIVVIPLWGLHMVAPGHWKSLFARVTGRDVLWMFLFALLNIVVTVCVGLLLKMVMDEVPNPAGAMLKSSDTWERLFFFANMAPQLLGEELITILPFLALMALFTKRFGASRKTALVGAWLVSAVLFGLVHLPTYGWNVVQCLAIIGTARLVLTLPWIMTKNLWVSTGAHIINDWTLFGLGLLGSGAAFLA